MLVPVIFILFFGSEARKNNVCLASAYVSPDGPVIWRMLKYPPTRRALLVGCGLQMFQQVSGINTVM